jgi:uncharacterized membrane protein HdeD (DUF308 family)
MEGTTERQPSDPLDMLTVIGRSWGWILFFGVMTLLAGILTVAWPGRTVLVIAVLFGLQLFVGGIFRLVAAFTDIAAGHRVAYTLIGIFSIVVGILCLRHIFQTVAALALILGIFWVVSGIMDFFTGIFVRDMPRRGWVIFQGVLAFIAGNIVLLQPAISLVTLAWVLGIWLIVYGTMEIMASLGLRNLARGLPTA